MRSPSDGQGERYFPRVGSVRPSHLLYAAGVGAVVDLPSISVLVRGLDAWDYSRVVATSIHEERLLAGVRRVLGGQVDLSFCRERPVGTDHARPYCAAAYIDHEDADGWPLSPWSGSGRGGR